MRPFMEASLLTLADAEKRHDDLMRKMRKIRRAIRDQQDTEGLVDEIASIKAEVAGLYAAIRYYREMAEYLIDVEPLGGPH